MVRIAVLSGTGMTDLADEMSNGASSNSEIRVDSQWGQVPTILVETGLGEVLLIDRHHREGEARNPPHEIEYRANIHAAKSFSPDLILSVNSVGTMIEDLPPGMIGVAGDVLDLATRPWTFYDDDAIHADRTSIFDKKASEICSTALSETQENTPIGLVVAQCIGPQFESPSEIDALVRLGADVVGMTLGPESRLIAETGIPYVAISCSSNWAAGRTPGNPSAEIDHHAVDAMAATLRARVKNCIDALQANY
ncbi:MAG: MTAP family purine nucleoside phosphorylase [Candidatus Thermoplasmatota archaeon]|nr:MTAP family purine nucleoside phosphorylase [Candidatus Thermoplasmatota archaeon]